MKYKIVPVLLSLISLSSFGHSGFGVSHATQDKGSRLTRPSLSSLSQGTLTGDLGPGAADPILNDGENATIITSGSGTISSSSLPEIVRVGTTVDDVSGYYDPLSLQIVLDVKARRAVLQLSAPLTEGEYVGYEVQELIPRTRGSSTVSQFPKLMENSISVFAPTGRGRMYLSGGQITGDATIRSKYIPGQYVIEGNFSYFNADASQPSTPSEGLATISFSLILQEQ